MGVQQIPLIAPAHGFLSVIVQILRVWWRILPAAAALAVVVLSVPLALMLLAWHLGSSGLEVMALVLAYAMALLLQAGTMLLAAHCVDGQRAGVRQVLRRLRSTLGLRLLLAGLLTILLTMLATVPGFMLLGVAGALLEDHVVIAAVLGIGGLVALAGGVCYAISSLAITAPVVALESRPLGQAIRRSATLAKGRRLWILGATMIAGLFAYVLLLALTLLLTTISMLAGLAESDAAFAVAYVIGVVAYVLLVTVSSFVVYRAVVESAEFVNVHDIAT